MDHKEFIFENNELLNTLDSFTDITSSLKNIVILGSIALITHTQGVNYFRKIKDIDVIVDYKYKEYIEEKLYALGFRKSTFIDKRMPFSVILRQFSESKYVRFFRKNSADIEILFTPFNLNNDLVEIELFPRIHVSIPISQFTTKTLNGNVVKTVSCEMLLAIIMLAHNTFGRIYRYGNEKREDDRKALEKCIDRKKYLDIIPGLKFRLGLIRVPIPKSVFSLA